MSNAKIDKNDVRTWLAYNDTTGLVEPVVVDPVTGALLIYVSSTTMTVPPSLNNSKIDANDVRTLSGFDDTSGMIEALR